LRNVPRPCESLFDAVNVGMMGDDDLRREIVVGRSKCVFTPVTLRVRALNSLLSGNILSERVQDVRGGPEMYVLSSELR